MSQAPYEKLLTYRYATYILDMTKEYSDKFLPGAENFRKRQEMFHAARSEKQCLAEGASQGTSLKGYIKMVGIAKGSNEELNEDYKDIARERQIEIWGNGDVRLKGYRIFIRDNQPDPPRPPLPEIELSTNVMIDLVTRQGYLVDQQRRGLEKKFIQEGGYTEHLYKKRRSYRGY